MDASLYFFVINDSPEFHPLKSIKRSLISKVLVHKSITNFIKSFVYPVHNIVAITIICFRGIYLLNMAIPNFQVAN